MMWKNLRRTAIKRAPEVIVVYALARRKDQQKMTHSPSVELNSPIAKERQEWFKTCGQESFVLLVRREGEINDLGAGVEIGISVM